MRDKLLYGIQAIVVAVVTVAPLQGQISVRSDPPAALIESSGVLQLTGRVSGALPGESATVNWSVNDQPLTASANRTTLTLGTAPAGVPLILKATSVFDPSKFAAVPVIRLGKSELTAIAFPEAVAYHPSTSRLYVATLVPRARPLIPPLWRSRQTAGKPPF